MLMKWCRERGAGEWSLDGDSLERAGELVATATPPLGAGAGLVLGVLTSELFARDRAEKTVRLDSSDWVVPSLSERARLLSKGRLLFEHCLESGSYACVLGFFDHELGKGPEARPIVAELLDWMVTERVSGSARPADRAALAEHMIDFGVSLLHGLPRPEALALAEDKDPT